VTIPVRVSRLHFPVTTLGPGRRLGIWFQGCSIRCPGCISADTWTTQRGHTTVVALCEAAAPWLEVADGVTVSGGEPFDQPAALHALLADLRTRWSGDVLVYSGHAREAIEPHLAAMSGLIDALISDPFEIAAPQPLALGGSDNRRLHFLTPLGRERFAACQRPAGAADRRFDLMLDQDGVAWLAGIPGRDDFARLRHLLEQQGHVVATSQDRSVAPAPAGDAGR